MNFLKFLSYCNHVFNFYIKKNVNKISKVFSYSIVYVKDENIWYFKKYIIIFRTRITSISFICFECICIVVNRMKTPISFIKIINNNNNRIFFILISVKQFENEEDLKYRKRKKILSN